MKTLKNLIVPGGLFQGDTTNEASVGDSITLSLDTIYDPTFPDSILGTISKVTAVNCDSAKSYDVEYDEADLTGATFLRTEDIIDYSVLSGLESETEARIAGDENLQDQIDVIVAGGEGVGSIIHAAPNKTTPVNTDEFGITDSAASFILKKLTWANIKATLKTYFDTLYASGGTNTGDQTSIVGITGTKTQFNTALTDGNFAFTDSTNSFAEPQFFGDLSFGQMDGTTGNFQAVTVNGALSSYNFNVLEEGNLTFYSTAERDAWATALNVVKMTGDQTIAGGKTFTNDLIVEGTAHIQEVFFSATVEFVTGAAFFYAAGIGSSHLTAITGYPQALSGAGAINLTTVTTAVTSTGVAQALTLADGTNGQIKTIAHVVDGGSAVLTPATKTGYTTITFTNAGETATLQFFTGAGWLILSLRGAVAA